jgi:hypothetical protein
MKKSLETLIKGEKYLLILFPVIYLVAGFYFRNLLGNLSLRSCDPDYIYFISGLTLSDGTFKLGHFDNPGTPLQIFMALIFKLIYFFRTTTTPYIEDVLLHPDLYLSVTNMMITAITSAVLYYCGKKVFQTTRSVMAAMLIQTTPFLPVIWYDLIGRIAPELIMTFPVILLTVLIIKIYKQGNPVTNKQLFYFSLIAAFGLSIKLTFLPLWLIPFLIMGDWKKKLIYIGLSLLLFLVIAFPVTLQLDFFWGWIKNLFLHSGQYGGGASDIIDFAALKSNLLELFYYERRYFYVFISLIALFSFYLVFFKKKAEKKFLLVTLAVILTIAIQLLMVGKHYAHRYFIPVLMLLPLMVFLITESTRKFFPQKMTMILTNIAIFAFLIWSIGLNSRWLSVKTEAMGSDIEQRLPTWHFASLLEKDSYRIITSQNYGSPFIEYTLMYSMAWACNAKKAEYAPILGKLYPFVYCYSTWDNTLKTWGEGFDANKISNSGKNVYLYLERNDEELYNKTISKLIEVNRVPFEVNREQVYLNPKTTEVIYRISFK